MTTRQVTFAVAVSILSLLSSRADCQWAANHPNNKTICETALGIFDRGTPQQRGRLHDYIYATFGDINALNLRHHGADMGQRIAEAPYEQIQQTIAAECRTDVSETVFAAVGRTYKREANPQLSR